MYLVSKMNQSVVCNWTCMKSVTVNTTERSDLVEIAGPPDRSNFISVVKKADTGLSQTITLPDLDLSKTFRKPLPNIRPKPTSCNQTNAVGSLLRNLETQTAL